MKASDIMRKKVVSFKPGDTIVNVLRTFSNQKISGAPVTEKGKLVGMITDSDIIAKLDARTPKVHFASHPDFLLLMAGIGGKGNLEKEMQVLKDFHVSDFMTTKIFTAEPDDTVTKIAGVMHGKKVNRLPVIRKGKLVGIVSRQDIVKALARF